MSYSPKNVNGQATMANSEPVVIASDQSAVPVSAASLPLPTGAATSAKQDTGNTSVASIDTKTPALGQALAAASVPVILPSATITTLTPPAAITGFATSAKQDTLLTELQLKADLTETQPVSLAAETTKVIGTVNIAAAQTLATVTTVGAVTAITNALPAGTNAIGKLSANSGVDIGDVDVTSVSGTVTTKGIPSDIDINGSNANHTDKYYTNAGAVTDGIVWSPAAGKRWHVLTLYINVSAAATVTLEDDLAAGDNARWKGELAANSGVVLTYDKEHPFCSAEDAADLIITTTAGNVYVQAVGYEI